MKKILFLILAAPLFVSFLFSLEKTENLINPVPQYRPLPTMIYSEEIQGELASFENPNFSINYCEDPSLMSASNTNLSVLIDGNNDFALAMYNLLKKEKKGNVFYSPYSISLIMAMAYAGAKDETATQIADAMRYKLSPDDLHSAFNFLSQSLATHTSNENDFSLKIVNDIWSQKDYYFSEDYIDTLTKHYGSALQKLDFIASPEKSRKVINDYIYEQTSNLIKDLIPQGAIDPFTRLVLTNAIYFKAEWQEEFNKNATFDGAFNLDNNREVTVPMMSQESFFKYTRNSSCQAIELPYKGDSIAMTIILPNDFSGFEESLTIDSLKEILNTMALQNIILQMPKFKFESTLNLKKTLSYLGMPIAFDPLKADFRGITPLENLYLQDVLQKALIIVDEKGTEAAAATAAIFGCRCTAQQTHLEQMIVDRPFMFFIFDRDTKSILFMGRVLNPLQN